MKTFSRQIYQKLCEVPRGKVTTYKLLANAVGSKAYRAVGQVMRHNPNAPTVPCHRVVASDGRLGGFMGSTDPKELAKKIKLLHEEGIEVKNNRIIDFAAKIHSYT